MLLFVPEYEAVVFYIPNSRVFSTYSAQRMAQRPKTGVKYNFINLPFSIDSYHSKNDSTSPRVRE